MAAEKRFENKIKKYLESKGIYPFGTPEDKMTVPIIGYWEKRFANRNTKKGLPDMHVVIRGYSLELEVKAQDGHPSELQIFNCNLIRKSGGFAFVVYPSGYEKLVKIIDGLTREEFTHDLPLILK